MTTREPEPAISNTRPIGGIAEAAPGADADRALEYADRAGREAMRGHRALQMSLLFWNTREDLHAVIRDAKRVQARHRRTAADLHDLQLSYDRVAIRDLRHPEDTICHSKDRITLFLLGVLSDEERRYLPRGEMQCEPLDKVVDRHRFGGAQLVWLSKERPERIDDDNAGLRSHHFADDALQHQRQILCESFLT